MSAQMKELINSPALWLITVGTIAIVWFLAYFCLAKSRKAAEKLNIPKESVKLATKTSIISSIGPSIVIATSMISLLAVAGAPTALMRLSVCGNIAYELQSAGIAAQVLGADGTAASMTPQIFQIMVFIMALGCIGYLLIPAIFVTKFDSIIKKVSGKDGKLTAIISTAAILGCYAYVDVPYILGLNASTVALIIGFIVMFIINKYNNKVKKEWISQWGLFSAMIVGMIGGIIAG